MSQKLNFQKRALLIERQKRKEFEDWFEEKVAVEFQLEREQSKAATFEIELLRNQEVFEIEI